LLRFGRAFNGSIEVVETRLLRTDSRVALEKCAEITNKQLGSVIPVLWAS